ncbi:MAG: hypothetical protein HYX48_01325 [Chlamydiales bacterium]|nr:hypothetical protein [Chlamydiales bacterium]
MSDGVRWRHTSRDHLALHLALPNRVLENRVGHCPTLYACPAFLRYGFAVRSESIGCSRRSSHFLRQRVPFASSRNAYRTAKLHPQESAASASTG